MVKERDRAELAVAMVQMVCRRVRQGSAEGGGHGRFV